MLKAGILQPFHENRDIHAVVAGQDFVEPEDRVTHGQRREVTGILARSSFKMRTQPEREAINAPIQGSAADMMKLAMLNVHRRIRDEKLPARMLLQIHDELVFEVDPAQTQAFAKIVEQEMAQAMPLSVPISVDVSAGPNWLETEPL